jgi:hypothetical protein
MLGPSVARRRLAIGAVRFFVVFVLLVVPWPHLGRIVSGLFIEGASAIAAPVLSTADAAVGFAAAPVEATEGDWDAVIFVKNIPSGNVRDAASIDVRRVWYLPTIVFVALSIALRFWSTKRLAIAFVVGLFALPMLSLLPILSFLTQNRAIHPGAAPQALLDIAYRALVAPLGMAYAVPAFLWLGLMLVAGTIPALDRPKESP